MRLKTTTALTCLLGLAAALPTEPSRSPSAIPEALPIPTTPPSPIHLEIRQGVPVTAAPVAATAVPGQVSPITTVQVGVVKDGAYVVVEQTYTQLFVLPLSQWPSPTAGSIGLGTIAGQVGVVKTKRDAMPMVTQLPSPPTDVLTLEGLRQMMNERPVEDETGMAKRDLVLTTEELNQLLVGLPVENGKRDGLITRELLNEMMAGPNDNGLNGNT